jgi:hypothetical protein
VIWPSLAFVAIGAGVASYLDALTVMQATIGHAVVAFIVAALADPVILATSADIRDATRRGAGRPRWSVLSLGVAIAMTVYLNVMAAYPHAVPPWLVRAWVPVAFLLTLESLMSYTKRGRGGPQPPPVPAAQIHPGSSVAAVAEPTREWLDEHLRVFLEELSPRELEAAIGISRGRIKAATATDAPAPVEDQDTPAGAGVNGNRPQ